MTRLRDALRGPNWESALILAVAALIGALALVAVLRPTAHRGAPPRRPSTAISTPGPVIGTKPIPPGGPPVGAAQLQAATLSARRFLNGYLGYLYGHTRARAVRDASPGLRAILARDPVRLTPAQRSRHQRLLALDAEPRAAGLAIATATIGDGAGAPYPIHLALAYTAGRWLVERVLP
jgi:hypothetical protein